MKAKVLSMVAVIILAGNFNCKSQSDNLRFREVGIGIGGGSGINLQYRWGKTKRIYRFDFSFSGNTTSSSGLLDNSFSGNSSTLHTNSNNQNNIPVYCTEGIRFSTFRFKKITERLNLIRGSFLSIQYAINRANSNLSGIFDGNSNFSDYFLLKENSTTNLTSLEPELGIILGFSYKITESLFFYAEMDPGFYCQFLHEVNTNSNLTQLNQQSQAFTTRNVVTFGIKNLSTSYIGISLVYRFYQ